MGAIIEEVVGAKPPLPWPEEGLNLMPKDTSDRIVSTQTVTKTGTFGTYKETTVVKDNGTTGKAWEYDRYIDRQGYRSSSDVLADAIKDADSKDGIKR